VGDLREPDRGLDGLNLTDNGRTVAARLTFAAKKEARRIAAGFDVLNLTLERAGCCYIWW
jgi:hypothetical protein